MGALYYCCETPDAQMVKTQCCHLGYLKRFCQKKKKKALAAQAKADAFLANSYSGQKVRTIKIVFA